MILPAIRRSSLLIALFLLATGARADDLHLKKNISIEGSVISGSETWIKGTRERTVTSGNIMLRQGDLKRTVTVNDQAQTYLIMADPLDENAARAAAMATGVPMQSGSGGKVVLSVNITDTNERKQMFGYTVRHLKTSVSIEPSADACSKISQKFEIDGWYADINMGQKSWSGFRPPSQMAEGCKDQMVLRTTGAGKPGYPLVEDITMHNQDASATHIRMETTELSKETLDASLFDVPANYHEVTSYAELQARPAAQNPMAAQQQMPQQMQPAQPPMGPMGAPNTGNVQAMMQQVMAQRNAMAQAAGQPMGQPMGPMGMGGASQQPMNAAPPPKVLGPKAPGKMRIGVAAPEAQVGQGSTSGDYSTPIRNSIVLLMDGPAVEIAALQSRAAIQVQAEAQQLQCDYVLYSSVAVKHATGGGFGKMMKMAAPVASSLTPLGAMHGMGTAVATQAAASAVQMTAEQQAMSQLTGFNTQIKQKDDVTVQYQLIPTGQTTPRLQNNLQAKAKSDGEDVLTPLLQQTVNAVLTEVTKK